VILWIGSSQGRQLYYGYFGGDDHGESLNHVNLHFCPGWGDDGTNATRRFILERVINCGLLAKNADIQVLFDISWILYVPVDYKRQPGQLRYRWGDAVTELTQFCLRLEREGLLPYTRAFYIVDEPERESNVPADLQRQVNTHVRSIIRSFPLIGNASLAVFYGDGRKYTAIDSYDWVGFDNYGSGNGVYNSGGEYDSMKRQLRSDQRTMLIPGGANPWRLGVAKSLEVALKDQQVAALLPFLWVTKDGIGANGMTKQYCQAGYTISHPGQPAQC